MKESEEDYQIDYDPVQMDLIIKVLAESYSLKIKKIRKDIENNVFDSIHSVNPFYLMFLYAKQIDNQK